MNPLLVPVFYFRAVTFLVIVVVMNLMLICSKRGLVDRYYDGYVNRLVYSPNSVLNAELLTVDEKGGSFIDAMKADSVREIKVCIVLSDIIFAFNMATLCMGFTTTSLDLGFIQGLLQLIGIAVMEHTICNFEDPKNMWSAFFFGVFLPFLVELYRVIFVLWFKIDHYGI